jgi:NAD(P)H-hydrate epimerase
MEAAGKAVVHAIMARWDKCEVLVLAGPGNNGGDGFVVARLLKAQKWPVQIFLLGERAALKGDAATNAKRWRSTVLPLDHALERLVDTDKDILVVDALFGAGLSKPLSGTVKALAEVLAIKRDEGKAPPVVAVDMPSGLHGDTGYILGDGAFKGVAFQADLTVTFCRPKPGHLLMPGRQLCGELFVADIGISDAHVAQAAALSPSVTLNTVDLWGKALPRPGVNATKYTRGHLVVLGGLVMTGAARMAALAARRAGAGLVSIAAPDRAFAIYAASCEPGTMIIPCNGLKEFKKIISDKRKSTCIMGPGAGLCKATRDKVLAALKVGKRLVLDADALSVFEDAPKSLFKALKGCADDVVMTPHGGEFARLFPDLAKKQSRLGKLEVTRRAASRVGCVILYKGADTVVAAPDGRAGITTSAPRTLATAGAGDVLAGFVGALLAQGPGEGPGDSQWASMPAFEAANAAAWLHGECANAFGPGLIAEDLIDELPEVLDWLDDLLD